jgi:hypothetical protein
LAGFSVSSVEGDRCADSSGLAKRSSLSESTVRDFEKGRRVPTTNNLAAIRAALERAGVTFTNHNEPGIKLRLAKGKRR